MNVTVVGLGGVGGFLGAKLARAYGAGAPHRVHFLARGAHLRAVQEQGLALVTEGTTILGRPWAAADAPSGWPFMDLILLCVKGFDLDAAARTIQPLVGKETLILPLQNGVGKRGRLEGILAGGGVAEGCIYVAANLQGPGTVVHVGGPGRLIFGRDPQDMERLAPHLDLLVGAGILAELSPGIEVEVWAKFLLLCALAGTTALYGEPLGPILAAPHKSRVLEGLMREVEALAHGHGIPLPEDAVSRGLGVWGTFPAETKSSLLHDLEHGRPNELDWLLGSAIHDGERLGVDVPLLKEVYNGIKAKWLEDR